MGAATNVGGMLSSSSSSSLRSRCSCCCCGCCCVVGFFGTSILRWFGRLSIVVKWELFVLFATEQHPHIPPAQHPPCQRPCGLKSFVKARHSSSSQPQLPASSSPLKQHASSEHVDRSWQLERGRGTAAAVTSMTEEREDTAAEGSGVTRWGC